MCAAASDLIAADDLDDVVARITARAPLEVRASRYLLAVQVGERLLHLGISIGRAVFPIVADDADGLLRSADAAMFGVKRTTRAGTLHPGCSR